MATVSKVGISWLYDGTRAKVAPALRKAGADPELVQRFFNQLDKKKKTGSGKLTEAGRAAFEDRLTEILDKKGITAIEDVKKKATAYAKKIKVEVRYKKEALHLAIDGKNVITVA